MSRDNYTMSVMGDGYEASGTYNKSRYSKGQQLSHRIKFDKYFLYGMDMTGVSLGS